MNKFREILTKLDPEKKLLSEAVQQELCDLMDSKEKEIKEESYSKALNLVSKKLEDKDSEHGKALSEAIENLKAQHAKELQELDESHAAALDKLFSAVDSSHAEKLEEVVEAIDTDHAAKLEKVAASIDTDHTSKLEKLQSLYESKQISEKLVDGISDYLDVYLEKVMPQAQLVNEAKLERLENFYSSVREMALVNDEYVQTEIKEAILDAKNQIDAKDAEIDNMMLEKVELSKKLKTHEATMLLEDKCKDRSPKAVAYLKTFFCESTKEEIEEKFDEALAAFDKDEAKARHKLLEEAESKQKVHAPATLIREQKEEKLQVVEESGDEGETRQINAYANLLKRSLK